MTTINKLRQRMETRYLEPVTEETGGAPLSVAISDTDTTFKFDAGVFSPDEESYIGPGRILELQNEMVRVTDYDQVVREVTCVREVRDTEAVAHPLGTEVRIPTRFPRKDTVEALVTAIEALWQPLFITKEELITVDTAGYLPLPLNTVRILSVEVETESDRWSPIQARLMNPHPVDPTMASVRIAKNPYQTSLCLVRYGVKVEVPADYDTEIEDLPAKWERIVLADAAAELLSGVDIDAVSQEFLTQQLRLERFPVRSGASISQSLIRYREYLVELAERDLKAASPRRVVHRRVSVWK